MTRFQTRAIHEGQEPDELTGAVIPPIHLSSTFRQDNVGEHKGYEYSRTGNPTRENLEKQVASLENAKHGIAFSSGSSATAMIQLLLEPGSHVICGDDVYGGTYRFFDKVMKQFNIDYDFIDLTNPDNLRKSIKATTKMVWLESPTNPLLKISDIEKLSEIATSENVTTVVDNTFATPYLQSPFKLGADIVVHSSTKYLGGHSDLVGGVIITNSIELEEKLRFLQNAVGAVPSPFDCWLLSRGIKTLALRMDQHCDNTEDILEFLLEQDKIEKIYYPFYENHFNVNVAKKQMQRGGGMISFDLKNKKAAHKFLSHLEIFSLAESLGGVESLAEYPPSMTHGSIESEKRKEIGINDGLVRLSIGIEHIDDLINDISKALEFV